MGVASPFKENWLQLVGAWTKLAEEADVAKHKAITKITRKFEKVFGPVRNARLSIQAMNMPKRIMVPDMTSREVQRLAKKLGLDPKIVEQKAARQTTQVLRSAEKYRTQMIKRSGTAKKFLDRTAGAWVRGGAVPQGQVERYFLDTPFLIWPTPGLPLVSAKIQPANSVVKFHFHNQAGDQGTLGIEEVSILFRWTNPSAYATMISVDGLIVFNGTAQAHAAGSWGDGTITAVGVYSYLHVYGDWDASHTLLAAEGEVPMGLLAETDGLFYRHSVTESGSVFRGFIQHIDRIAVPANGEITLSFDVQIGYQTDPNGFVDLDFASGSFSVLTPGIFITQWPPQWTAVPENG
jgi:hypothetical protein